MRLLRCRGRSWKCQARIAAASSEARIAAAAPRSLTEAAEKDGNAAAALPHAVATVGAPSEYTFGGAEERQECGDVEAATAAPLVAPFEAPSAAVAGLYGYWRGYSKLCC
jgi:hypothetical protein